MILDRIIIYGLISALVASGVWGVVHGESRYAAGLAAERRHWEASIAAANDRIRQLENADTHAADSAARSAAVAELSALPLGPVSADVATAASYPPEVLAALNAIKVRR